MKREDAAGGGAPISQRCDIHYGMNELWPTPVKRLNLLESGIVDAGLHDWLDRYAESPHLVTGSLADVRESSKLYSRRNLAVFDPPEYPELARIKEVLVVQADEYAREVFANPLPEHEKTVYAWFAVQRTGCKIDEVGLHYHEAGDVALVYYVSVPSNSSGRLILADPRGAIDRGGLVFPRRQAFVDHVPRRGDLLVLPRYLLHRTTENTDTHSRKVISAAVKYERRKTV